MLLNLNSVISSSIFGLTSFVNMLCLATGSMFSAPAILNPIGMALLSHDLTCPIIWSRYAFASILCWVVPQLWHVTYGESDLI